MPLLTQAEFDYQLDVLERRYKRQPEMTLEDISLGKNPDLSTIVGMLQAAGGKAVPITAIVPKMVTGTKDTIHVRWAVRARLAKRGYNIVVAGRRQEATLQLVGQPAS